MEFKRLKDNIHLGGGINVTNISLPLFSESFRDAGADLNQRLRNIGVRTKGPYHFAFASDILGDEDIREERQLLEIQSLLDEA